MALGNWAIVADAPGGPEVLVRRECEVPAPQPGEVLIRHRAIGLNFIDTYFRSGSYPWTSTPLIPGAEAAGVVESVGAGVTRWQPGDRVAYVLPNGGYCLFRTVNADRLVRLPPTLSDTVAASVMLKGLTVHCLVTSCHVIQAGDVALVHAAAGGVGTLMGQWLKALGATAIGTVGSDAKTAQAKTLGYEHVINYRTEDFVARVKELTAGRGCDVVYDSVGRDTWHGSLQCLRRRGMAVSFGQSSGAVVDFKLSQLAAGSLFATRPMLFDYISEPKELEGRATALFDMLEMGRLVVDARHVMPLAEAAQAHRMLESRMSTGSTILVP